MTQKSELVNEFSDLVEKNLRSYERTNPRDPVEVDSIDAKAQAVLNELGLSFEGFLQGVDYASLDTNDYSDITNINLKKKLFRFRARIYLSSLKDMEEKGFDPHEVLQGISDAKIPPIKKEAEEPTYVQIAGLFSENNLDYRSS